MRDLEPQSYYHNILALVFITLVVFGTVANSVKSLLQKTINMFLFCVMAQNEIVIANVVHLQGALSHVHFNYPLKFSVC